MIFHVPDVCGVPDGDGRSLGGTKPLDHCEACPGACDPPQDHAEPHRRCVRTQVCGVHLQICVWETARRVCAVCRCKTPLSTHHRHVNHTHFLLCCIVFRECGDHAGQGGRAASGGSLRWCGRGHGCWRGRGEG